jgi:hypothetical protein
MGYRLFEDKKINEVLNSVKQEIQSEREKKILEKSRIPNFFRIEILNDEKKIEKTLDYTSLDELMNEYINLSKDVAPKNIRFKVDYPELGTIYLLYIANTKINYMKNKDKKNKVLFYSVSTYDGKNFKDVKCGSLTEAYDTYMKETNGKSIKLSFCYSNVGIIELARRTI